MIARLGRRRLIEQQLSESHIVPSYFMIARLGRRRLIEQQLS